MLCWLVTSCWGRQPTRRVPSSLQSSPPEEKFRSDAWANRRYQKLAKVSTGSQVGSGMLDLLPAPNRRLFSWLLLWACIILTAMLGLSYVSKTGWEYSPGASDAACLSLICKTELIILM